LLAALLACVMTACGDATLLLNGGGRDATPQTIVLTGEAVESSSVRLQWTSAASGVSYQLERNGASLARLRGLAYVDAALQAGQQYCYRVYAYGGFGWMARSNEFCVGTAPGPPGWRLEQLGAGRSPAVAVDSAGEAHVCHARAGDGIVYRRVAPGRATVIVDPDGAGQCSIAVDGAGVVHIAYLSRFGLRHASHRDGQWRASTVDAEAAAAFQVSDGPALALAPDGSPRIAYRRLAGGGATTVAVAARVPAGWSYDLTGLAGHVGPRSLAIDAAGRDSLALIDLVGQSISLWTRGPAVWSRVYQQGLAPTRDLGAPAVIDAAGNPATAWWRRTALGLRTASLTVATRGNVGWREEVVAQSDDVGWRVTLVRGRDELLRLGWVDSSGSVFVATERPTGWDVEPVPGQVGFAESVDIALSALGELRVVYDLPLQGIVVIESYRP
jgi:hypothetical protein